MVIVPGPAIMVQHKSNIYGTLRPEANVCVTMTSQPPAVELFEAKYNRHNHIKWLKCFDETKSKPEVVVSNSTPGHLSN